MLRTIGCGCFESARALVLVRPVERGERTLTLVAAYWKKGNKPLLHAGRSRRRFSGCAQAVPHQLGVDRPGRRVAAEGRTPMVVRMWV